MGEVIQGRGSGARFPNLREQLEYELQKLQTLLARVARGTAVESKSPASLGQTRGPFPPSGTESPGS